MADTPRKHTGGILLTGFEPFGGDSLNPSAQIALALDGRYLDGAPVAGEVLPCRFGAALDALERALARHQPALVLCLGQAAGRVDFSLERVAINLDDARQPDNAGVLRVDQPVVPGAPVGYFSTLPLKSLVAGLRSAGWPASVSNSAGSFVCNHVFFGLMHALAGRSGIHADLSGGTRGGFMHLPLSAPQAARQPGSPGWPLEWMTDGVWKALELAWRHQGPDLPQAEGLSD